MLGHTRQLHWESFQNISSQIRQNVETNDFILYYGPWSLPAVCWVNTSYLFYNSQILSLMVPTFILLLEFLFQLAYFYSQYFRLVVLISTYSYFISTCICLLNSYSFLMEVIPLFISLKIPKKLLLKRHCQRRSKAVTVCRWHDTIHRES